jgi:hypothetical protein
MKSTFLRSAILAAVACGIALPASAGELKLTMQDGRVTLIADNVPLRQILQEWARVGQAQIVNADKVSGPAMTLQLVDTPEKDALDILLRTASGYIAAPRPVMVANAALYDRITIMATSRAPAASAVNNAVPTFQRPPMPVDDNDEPINVQMPPHQPQINNGGLGANQVVNQFPPGFVPPNMSNGQPQQPQQPITSPRPGIVMPQPGQPGQPGAPNPYQPSPTLVRPPGSGGPGGPGGPGGGN